MHRDPVNSASVQLELALEQISKIEEAAADAVPPAVVNTLDGWRLRFNHGLKRRPNSVLANVHMGKIALEEKARRAEAFYRTYGMKQFQLSVVPLTF